ncbi:hypothetical protein ASF06_14790 [Agreia sp. Leaf244]|uniref:hypothetical protein n=1 Tax=Agreia sp. Leaf244 TaxID=1736305 RepID=UPI0007008B4E|nr:hypothetical protein [Agreia sp. Leaf244]KQO06348.1 hypothetical protein ASF06_14790 [Agreia sp. Leaf244]
MSDATAPGAPLPGEDPTVLSRLVRARQIGPRAVSALKDDLAKDSRLGYGYLGIGAVAVGSFLFLRGLAAFVLDAVSESPAGSTPLRVIAWALLAIAFVGSALLARRHHGRHPALVFSAAMVLLALALLIETIAVLGTPQPILHSSTIYGVGATLLALVGSRPARELLLANGAFAVVIAAMLASGIASGSFESGPSMQRAAAALLPPLIGAVVVRGFGTLVQLELDRSAVESTLLAPRFAFGMRASDELARLDLDAERILDGVASGSIHLPLDPKLAADASSIATELRLLLVAGRHDTWLHHAIEESEVLGPVVTLTDPQGLAGFLEASEREGLLSAVWLLVAESVRVQPTLQIVIGPRNVEADATAASRIGFPVALTVDGVPRRRIDPAVWPALDRVGDHSEMIAGGSMTIVTTVRTVAQQAAG